MQSVLVRAGDGTTYKFVNKCRETVWPGILSNAGSPQLQPTGFELASASSRSLQAPTGWSGRFWARTGCSASSGDAAWSCATGDCGSGQVECNGAGAAPPATLAEFTLASSSAAQDFYDVSLVDGYNLPVLVQASRGCAATGCVVDMNARCPAELKVGEACRSACDAFRKPEYCCSGAYASPATCRPTAYSQVFKAACPKSYSYAFDDPTSTFTCTGGADYTITFCPDSFEIIKRFCFIFIFIFIFNVDFDFDLNVRTGRRNDAYGRRMACKLGHRRRSPYEEENPYPTLLTDCIHSRWRPTDAAAIVVYSAPHSHPDDVFSPTPLCQRGSAKGLCP
ncbi:hypothetical protein B296_00059255 [Ensete ventricosum]|uniref:Thaumatin-like protein n=1 Tax=Ensete ventricosum TaxID=4639 RepID=A0A426X449_ENSVE|nr:hypothetical protein B296_00059255 [Ensete ventricosum]